MTNAAAEARRRPAGPLFADDGRHGLRCARRSRPLADAIWSGPAERELVRLEGKIPVPHAPARRHVTDGADRRAGVGVVMVRVEHPSQAARSQRFGQARIKNLHPPLTRDQDVGRLQIAVHDSSRMSAAIRQPSARHIEQFAKVLYLPER